MAGDEFEGDEAEAGVEPAGDVEEPEGSGGHRFVETADPASEPVREEERVTSTQIVGGRKSECEFELGGDHAGRIAAAAR